jgi:hypothetical protein
VFNPATGHTYFLLEKKPWTDSEAEAVAMGGHLVAVNNAAENQFLLDIFCSGPNTTRVLWIGLNDVGSEGNFHWTTGEPLTYTNWFTGEPNNNDGRGGPENYVQFNWHKSFPDLPPSTPAGKWVDDINTGFGSVTRHPPPAGPFNGVVEIVPEPAALLLMALGALSMMTARRRTSS